MWNKKPRGKGRKKALRIVWLSGAAIASSVNQTKSFCESFCLPYRCCISS